MVILAKVHINIYLKKDIMEGKIRRNVGKSIRRRKAGEKFVRTEERHVMTPFTIRAGIAAIHPIPVSRYIALVNQATVVRVPLTR